MTPRATGRNVWGSGPNGWYYDPGRPLDKMFVVSQDTLSPSHFVFLSSLLAGSDPPCLYPSPAAKSIFFAYAACARETAVPAAAGGREIAVPQQWHPKRILLLAFAAKCVCVSGAIKCTWPGKRRGALWAGDSGGRHLPGSESPAWTLVLFAWTQGKILLSYATGRPISGLNGKKMRPILLKCLHIKFNGFGPWWFFWAVSMGRVRGGFSGGKYTIHKIQSWSKYFWWREGVQIHS